MRVHARAEYRKTSANDIHIVRMVNPPGLAIGAVGNVIADVRTDAIGVITLVGNYNSTLLGAFEQRLGTGPGGLARRRARGCCDAAGSSTLTMRWRGVTKPDRSATRQCAIRVAFPPLQPRQPGSLTVALSASGKTHDFRPRCAQNG
jgi:hypothetical protein